MKPFRTLRGLNFLQKILQKISQNIYLMLQRQIKCKSLHMVKTTFLLKKKGEHIFAVQGLTCSFKQMVKLGFLICADCLDSLKTQSLWGREEKKKQKSVLHDSSELLTVILMHYLQIMNTARSLEQVFFSPFGAYDRSYCTIAKARRGKLICITCFNKAIRNHL